MPKKKKVIRTQDKTLEFLRPGTVPDALLQRRIADVKRGIIGRSKEGYAIDRQYAKYRREIQKSQKSGNESRMTQALDGVLGIHKKLAKQKLAAPAVRAGVGGIVAGRLGATITPPFDYAFSLYDTPAWSSPFFGNPTLSASANKDTGQISNSAVTEYQAPSSGNVYSEMGIYLRSPWGPANLSVSASPAYTFEWWANSIHPGGGFVTSAAGAWLGIYARQGDSPDAIGASSNITAWFGIPNPGLLFDWGSNPGASVSAELNGLDPSYECLLYIAVVNQVDALGWPGTLAGSMMSVTTPYISFELDLIQVISPI